MTGKKSFLIILRIVFLLFSLQFLKDAFYKWDGYSYYMRFTDFLPELSLVYILWTIIGVIIAVAAWLTIYVLFKIIPKSLIPVRLEHILIFFIFIVLPLFIKRTFYSDFSFSELIGSSRITIILIGVVLATVIVWFGRKYAEKILSCLNARITPLVWLFVIVLILAVPFSVVLKKGASKAEYIPNNSARVDSKEKKRPNIILVIMDALTTQDMQISGYERPTTPFISKWAKDAVVFNRAYASANWTTPAMMSLMTGQRLWTHGVWHLIYYHPIDNYEKNLPAILRNYGYDVYSFIQNQFAHPDTLGIKAPFLTRDKSHTFWIPSNWWLDKLKSFFLNKPIVKEWIFEVNSIAKKINSYRPDILTTTVPPDIVYNRFLKHISERQLQDDKTRRPFFAWLHVFPPHEPYLPQRPYMGMFGDAEKFNTNKKQENIGTGREYKPEEQADMDILRKRYDEFILYSDKQFELFLLRLAKVVDMSNTIIIFTSDHGESFSHGWLAHRGPHLYESLVHIPLIIKMPLGIDSRNRVVSTYRGKKTGKVIDILVEHTDIAPTILEFAGIPVPEWMEGRSLVPLLNGLGLQPQPIFSMQLSNNRMIGNYPITKGTIAVWDGDYKLIYYLEEKKTLLFNLRSDPNETTNIFNEKPDIAQRLQKLIDNNLSRTNARITQAKESP